MQVFDFRNLLWSNIKLKPNSDKFEDSGLQEVLPAISAHNMVKIHVHNYLLRLCVFICLYLPYTPFVWFSVGS